MIDTIAYSRFLEKVSEDIDIPPHKYNDAVNRYESVGRWLEGGEYPGAAGTPSIYPQGSFRLGTVTRPIRDGVEASYDIDLVSELLIPKNQTDPSLIKAMIGNRLKENGIYRRLLNEEGKRCWTLEYAEEDGIGFHLDVLPSIPDSKHQIDHSIAITDRHETYYTWSASNPKGYGIWFDKINKTALQKVSLEQRVYLQKSAPDIYARIEDVPTQLIRTPLQRSIQLMKRHRDIKFNNKNNNRYAPISIIITTLAAKLYQNESDVFTTLKGIITRLSKYSELMNNIGVNRSLTLGDFITRSPDGKWYIGNPVNNEENFADRWHEDNHARAHAFFNWVKSLNEDFIEILSEAEPEVFRRHLPNILGPSVTSPHLSLIIPKNSDKDSTPRIHISGAAKPWRS